MEDLFLVLAFISLLALIVGMVKPSLVIKWGSNETKKRKKVIIAFGGALVVFFILFGITSGSQTENEPVKENNKYETLSIGEDGIVNDNKDKSDCEGGTILGTTKENYNEFLDAQIVDDKSGYLQMLGYEQIFHVDNCIKVKVIDSSFAVKKVRVLEGERAGQAGWTAYEYLINN